MLQSQKPALNSLQRLRVLVIKISLYKVKNMCSGGSKSSRGYVLFFKKRHPPTWSKMKQLINFVSFALIGGVESEHAPNFRECGRESCKSSHTYLLSGAEKFFPPKAAERRNNAKSDSCVKATKEARYSRNCSLTNFIKDETAHKLCFICVDWRCWVRICSKFSWVWQGEL